MKSVTKIIPIICFLVVSILSIFFFDTKQRRTFFEFENMKNITIAPNIMLIITINFIIIFINLLFIYTSHFSFLSD